ncbi:MAG: MSMEG_4193 family putative phosphomutase [Actinobacteria bacterium]|uniref:Unannotated protein n=1 Tax=freshwater metagenome TaxID=449393 RepID=A0A6J6ME62_9ZZZZ|nr:MSMEG_4193 family putative phosphomutase [Actinomycetota bacterium]MSX24546.1 MSMEG_4193 family putative phosphomutase [Actinomycetota bacterium]MSY46949.1 MSMEG_4193 family putative phosphomutase [Actinomycetota bacterium]MTB00230.1 MSMEG_4193 family putative phosphomutase [Actinomycetota bacterium]
MTVVVLIRHAHSTANNAGVLSGRLPGVHLSEIGIEQSKNLAERLGDIKVRAILTSPLERCQESIAPWVSKYGGGIAPTLDKNLSEVDYGSWSGRKLTALYKERLWKDVQNNPSRVVFPEGEAIAGMTQRAMSVVHRAIDLPGKGPVLLVSHGDVIKAIITSALGMHGDEFQRFVVDPASISVIDFGESKARLLLANDSRGLVRDLLATKQNKATLLGGGAGLAKKKVR